MSKEELNQYTEGRVIDGSKLCGVRLNVQFPIQIKRDFVKSGINEFIDRYNQD